ncbi:hypothetical protein HZB60_08360 [candidate division KSB1 bacterium]|nr:hypothetical protein [candidate division KSB1 bacterium]
MRRNLTCVIGILVLGVTLSGQATILDVPGQYSAISTAISASQMGDTVLVHRGTYLEKLNLPSHDIVLASEYLFGGDPAAIAQTVVDASSYAADDTACVLCCVQGSTRATLVSGFTLTGGHGVRPPNPEDLRRWGGGLYIIDSHPVIANCMIFGNQSDQQCAFYAEGSVARITNCELAGNCGAIGVGYFFFNGQIGDSAEFIWNDVHSNYGCMDLGPELVDPEIGARESYVSFRYNSFHDYTGYQYIGIELYRSHGAIIGNRFERIHALSNNATVIRSTLFAHTISDNVFLDLDLSDGSCISLSNNGNLTNPHRSILERNWFDGNVSNIGIPAIWMSEPNAEIRDNVIMNCVGQIGAIQLSQTFAQQGCAVLIERNQFWFNTRVGDYNIGSAFRSVGVGPPCIVRNNWFEGNSGIAVDYELDPDTGNYDMTNNYWGDPSGPYHPIENPEGLGDTVDVGIHVTPWLTEPPQAAPDIRERLHLNPDEWSLDLPFPNPFNATTTIRLIAQKPQPLEVAVYNTLGRRVGLIWRGVLAKDSPTQVQWDGRDDRGVSVASGVYYVVAVPQGSSHSAPKTVKALLLR